MYHAFQDILVLLDQAPIAYSIFFFFNDTATTEIYTLSLHDALPIYSVHDFGRERLRVALVIELLVLVRDHVEQHGEEPLIAARLVAREVARADQHVVRVFSEIALVLAVGEQQVHAYRRRLRLEGVGD